MGLDSPATLQKVVFDFEETPKNPGHLFQVSLFGQLRLRK
jgi:hypothetical protein